MNNILFDEQSLVEEIKGRGKTTYSLDILNNDNCKVVLNVAYFPGQNRFDYSADVETSKSPYGRRISFKNKKYEYVADFEVKGYSNPGVDANLYTKSSAIIVSPLALPSSGRIALELIRSSIDKTIGI